MAPDSGEADAAALRDRVADLEQSVAEQQATIDSLAAPTASRRGVLAALTGVAGAGALGAYSQRASAQAAGQVGTQSEPVDVEAYDLNVQNQLAGDLDAGGNSLTNVAAVETGKVSIDEMAEVYTLPSAQTIPNNSLTTVNFDVVEDGSESSLYNMSSGVLTFQEPGDYAASILLADNSLSAGDSQDIQVLLNGDRDFLQFDQAGSTFLQSISTTYVGQNISANDELRVEYRQGSSSDSELSGSGTNTRMSIWRLG